MNKMQSQVYRWFLEHGEGRHASMGGSSNAYVVARDTGRIPGWVDVGSAAKAAAMAGLRVRKLRQKGVGA